MRFYFNLQSLLLTQTYRKRKKFLVSLIQDQILIILKFINSNTIETSSQTIQTGQMFSIFNKKTDDRTQTEQNPRNQFVSPKRKPFSEIIYQQKVAKLPLNFAQSVLDLQMQLQFVQTYNMDIVIKLNQLYRIAIEHYINQDIKKANHFQRKLTTLLTNPQTVQLMDRKTLQQKQLNSKVLYKSLSKNISGIEYTTSLRKEINKFNNQSDILVKSMIEGVQKIGERNHRFIQSNIVSQQEQLKKRLEIRSRSRKVQQ